MSSKPVADPSEAQRFQELLAEEEIRCQSIELDGGVRTAGIDYPSDQRHDRLVAAFSQDARYK